MKQQLKIAGAILAGGKAERLNGIAKGNIKIKQCTIMEQLIAAFNRAGINDIVISANNPEPYKNYQKLIVPDLKKNIGPLAGIESILIQLQQYDVVMFLPCDLPNITAQEILILKAAINTNNIIYATTNARSHPLCAVIPTNKLTAITKSINKGERKILTIWQKLNAKTIKFNNENKFYNVNSRALIWIISGAGRGVGKTTLANNLCAILPNSIYAKYGHGKFKLYKQKNFFSNLDAVYTFIDDHIYTKQHVIIEANAIALSGRGDIIIFIDAIKNKTYVRKDANKLKETSDLLIDNKVTTKEWQATLKKYAITKNLWGAIIKSLTQQQLFIYNEN